MPREPAVWHLYMLRTRSGALYTGITTNVARRFEQHSAGKGARALRAKGPLTLVYAVAIGERGPALKLEYALKQLPRAAKEALVNAQPSPTGLASTLGKTLA
jgi:putative endonuclease